MLPTCWDLKETQYQLTFVAYICEGGSAGTRSGLRHFVLEGEGRRHFWCAVLQCDAAVPQCSLAPLGVPGAGPEQGEKHWREVAESSMVRKNGKHLLPDSFRQFYRYFSSMFTLFRYMYNSHFHTNNE